MAVRFFLLVVAATALLACGGGGATPESPAGGVPAPGSTLAPASRAASAQPAAASRVIDGTGVCPYTSELDPAAGRVWPGCHVFAPMDFEFPLVACTQDRPCLKPCRRTNQSGGSVSSVHDYRYDEQGRLVEEVVRDTSGNVTSTTRYTHESATLWHIEESHGSGGKQTTMKLDRAGRLTERVSRFTNGTTLTFRFHYDEKGRPIKEDRISEKRGKTEDQPTPYEYDEKGRLVARQRPHVGSPEFRYVYGADGKVETIEYHGGDWHVRRDAAGRVVELLLGTQPFSRFVYDAEGRLTEVRDVHGETSSVVRAYTYDCKP